MKQAQGAQVQSRAIKKNGQKGLHRLRIEDGEKDFIGSDVIPTTLSELQDYPNATVYINM